MLLDDGARLQPDGPVLRAQDRPRPHDGARGEVDRVRPHEPRAVAHVGPVARAEPAEVAHVLRHARLGVVEQVPQAPDEEGALDGLAGEPLGELERVGVEPRGGRGGVPEREQAVALPERARLGGADGRAHGVEGGPGPRPPAAVHEQHAAGPTGREGADGHAGVLLGGHARHEPPRVERERAGLGEGGALRLQQRPRADAEVERRARVGERGEVRHGGVLEGEEGHGRGGRGGERSQV